MSLGDLVSTGRLHRHRTSRQEVSNLLGIADLGLRDARVKAISFDRRFSAAYDAARSLATVVLACGGYRTAGYGHHSVTFEALPLIMGGQYSGLSAYFDTCRAKRNIAEYRCAGQVMAQELAELIETTEEFRREVLAWLRKTHPTLYP